MSRYTAHGRVNYRSEDYVAQYRVDGTAAVAPQAIAGGEPAMVSAAVRENRKRALAIGSTYVFFIALISAASVLICVKYLQMKRAVKVYNTSIEKLESRLSTLRSENDALYESVMNSIDWQYIRDRAVYDLGMKYAAEEQIVWYNTDDSYYIRQYCDVPS